MTNHLKAIPAEKKLAKDETGRKVSGKNSSDTRLASKSVLSKFAYPIGFGTRLLNLTIINNTE
jgi:hypothetical protein